jgi:CTP:molybdopterin cytidylyltransferase MocA
VKLAAVILAAGAGRRLGGIAKALLKSGEHTFLERIVTTARSLGLVDAVVVVGAPFGEAVAEHARSLGLRVVVNPDPGRGMASSVALGFAALTDGDAAWLWPVDHPHVTTETLRALVTKLGETDVAQPRFGERGGHPPLIARRLWPRLVACGELDGGARAVIATATLVAVAIDDAGVVRDIDTPADAGALG